MRQQFAVLHKMLLDTVRHDPACRHLMTAPGIGVVVALAYRATVDQPQRFVHSRAVSAHVALTPRRHQSGEIDHDSGISKSGDTMLSAMLYEAAQSLLTRSGKWSWLKAWGTRVAQRRGGHSPPCPDRSGRKWLVRCSRGAPLFTGSRSALGIETGSALPDFQTMHD
jgi:transposase